MPTVRVTSGVSVKMPVVIQWVERWDADGDVAAELVARTALEWCDKTQPDDETQPEAGAEPRTSAHSLAMS